MADGSQKPIRDVEVGDLVVATETASGATAAKPVIDLIRHENERVMYEVRLADGSTVEVTDEHPFWEGASRTWMRAEQLRPGHLLRTANGAGVKVVSVRAFSDRLPVYNFSVAEFHTYYVGQTPVLVHNCLNAEKAIRSLQKRLDEHREKLAAYRANPDAYDNKGILAGASPEVRQRIIEGRVRHLEQEIANFQNQINALRGGG